MFYNAVFCNAGFVEIRSNLSPVTQLASRRYCIVENGTLICFDDINEQLTAFSLALFGTSLTLDAKVITLTTADGSYASIKVRRLYY
jgi:hypothetical protein